MRVGLVVSGNLAGDTMWLVWRHLTRDPECECRLYSDGFVIGEACDFPPLHDLNALLASPDAVDVVALSMRSPGDLERRILQRCRECGTGTVLVLADLGSGSQKFSQRGGFVWPDRLCVADQLTRQLLLDSGAPEDVVLAVGSPYLDYVCEAATSGIRGAAAPLSAYVCSVPNREDFLTWERPVAYTESDVISGIHEVGQLRRGWQFVLRPHPKELAAGLGAADPRIRVEDANARRAIHEAIPQHSVCISTYSTALLVAAALGVAAVSFQPHRTVRVREALYRAVGIPLVSTAEELACALDRLEVGECGERLRRLLFHPGRAVHVVRDVIADVAHRRVPASVLGFAP